MARLIGAHVLPRRPSWEVPLSNFDLTPSSRTLISICLLARIVFPSGSPLLPPFPHTNLEHQRRRLHHPSISFARTFFAPSSESCRECDSTNGMKTLCMSGRSDAQFFCVIVNRSHCEWFLQRSEHHVFRRGQLQDSGRRSSGRAGIYAGTEARMESFTQLRRIILYHRESELRQ